MSGGFWFLSDACEWKHRGSPHSGLLPKYTYKGLMKKLKINALVFPQPLSSLCSKDTATASMVWFINVFWRRKANCFMVWMDTSWKSRRPKRETSQFNPNGHRRRKGSSLEAVPSPWNAYLKVNLNIDCNRLVKNNCSVRFSKEIGRCPLSFDSQIRQTDARGQVVRHGPALYRQLCEFRR